MYTLELFGFLGFDRRTNLTLSQARLEWQKAKLETYKAYSDSDDEMINTRWAKWEIYKNGEKVNCGNF